MDLSILLGFRNYSVLSLHVKQLINLAWLPVSSVFFVFWWFLLALLTFIHDKLLQADHHFSFEAAQRSEIEIWALEVSVVHAVRSFSLTRLLLILPFVLTSCQSSVFFCISLYKWFSVGLYGHISFTSALSFTALCRRLDRISGKP